MVAPNSTERVAAFLEPGSRMINGWMLAGYMPFMLAIPVTRLSMSPLDVGAMIGVCLGGLLANLAVTARFAGVVCGEQGCMLDDMDEDEPPAPRWKPHPKAQQLTLFGLAAGAAATASLSQRSVALNVALNVYFFCATALSWCTAQRVKGLAALKGVHPFFVCTALTFAAVAALGGGLGLGLRRALEAYTASGASRTLAALLLSPSIISWGLQLYARRAIVAERLRPLCSSVCVVSCFSLLGTALAVRALRLTEALRLALLPRHLTSPLAMEVAARVGGPATLCFLVSLFTGLSGLFWGRKILDMLRIFDPAARGMALGGAASIGGVIALQEEPDAAAFAAVTSAMTGAVSIGLVCIPWVRDLLVKAALG